MTDEGRLDLDEDGRLIEGDRTVDLVDLADPSAVEELAPARVRPWLAEHVAPWARRHRRPLAVTAAIAAIALAGATWVSTRPPYVAPTVDLVLGDAPVDGNDLGGPAISPDGVLSVAYTARAASAGDSVEVLGIVGPGLVGSSGNATITSTESGRVELQAQVECRDPAIAATTAPSSYGLSVRRTAADGDVLETLVPFGTSTSELDLAVAGHCLAERAASDLVVEPGLLDARPGVPTATLSFVVRNTGPVPLTVATERLPTNAIEVDLSPTVSVPSGGAASITTRVLVHDCSAVPALPALGGLPHPQSGADPSAPGVALQVGLGRATAFASYRVDGEALGRELKATVCSGAPAVSAALESVDGVRADDGSWLVSGIYAMRTDGVRIRVGREHFAGPAAGEGSILSTPDTLVPGAIWNLAPAVLDGGAGHLSVSFSGYSCADLATTVPSTLALGITMPDRTVYSFELPVDDIRLVRAAYRACRIPVPSSLAERGWKAAAAT